MATIDKIPSYCICLVVYMQPSRLAALPMLSIQFSGQWWESEDPQTLKCLSLVNVFLSLDTGEFCQTILIQWDKEK